jgi:D-alanine-D-alanine ligase
LLHLPEATRALNVALVYNQKKEDSSQQLASVEAPGASTTSDEAAPRQPASHLSQSDPKPFPDYSNDLYAEWDTFETIDAVRAALAERHTVTMIEADETAFDQLRLLRPDIVFNIAEGLYGVSREAQVPAMLEMLQIPYTGSDPLTLGICLDKSRAKEILSYYHIPTPAFCVVENLDQLLDTKIKFPSIVKPLREGSSKGILNSSIVASPDAFCHEVERILKNYHEPALVEQFLPGREFTVALLGNGGDLTVLPIVEIKFDSLPAGVNKIYSYEAKWIWDTASNPLDIFDCPARIPESLEEEIGAICKKAYQVLHCRDWCRIDVRLDAAGRPHIIELNPLPGILPKPEDNSCFPKAARAAGLSYNGLMQTVLASAAQRAGLIKTTSPHVPSS